MKATVTSNAAELSSTFREYASWINKDGADIANNKLLQVVFEALKQTKNAARAEIEALPSQPWWPKYVAKRITQKGVSFRKGAAKINIQGNGFNRADAEIASKKIIAARLRSIGFLKSGWIPAIKKLWPLVKDKARLSSSVGGARQFGADKGSARPAIAGARMFAEALNSAEGIQKFGPEAVERAMVIVIADMRSYISRKLQERARSVARTAKSILR